MANQKRKIIRVLFIASEAEPFVKVGGLGDVAGSLPKALHSLAFANNPNVAIDIRLCIPFYKTIDLSKFKINSVGKFRLPVVNGTVPGEIFQTDLEGGLTCISDQKPRYLERSIDL